MKKILFIIAFFHFTSSINAQNNIVAKELTGKIYHTEEHIFDEKNDKWEFINASNPIVLYISFVGVHLGGLENVILINSQNPIRISYKELKITTENKDVITFEADARFKSFSDDISSNCRISISSYKNSGMTVLHIFFIKKKWLSFYYSKESSIEDIYSNKWSLKSLTLPDEDISVDDIEVQYYYSKENKINYNTILSNIVPPQKRAKVTFSKNSLTILLFDKNGYLLEGKGSIGEIFYIEEKSATSITYVRKKIINEDEFEKSTIYISSGLPYSNLYSIIFSYNHSINNKTIDGFIAKKSNFLKNTKFKLF